MSGSSLQDKRHQTQTHGEEMPSVCVTHELFSDMLKDSSSAENYCRSTYDQTAPKIPNVVVIAPFVPMVGQSSKFTELARQQQEYSCNLAGPFNWAFAMQLLYAYKLSIGSRKVLIREMRKNLVASDFKDKDNKSVREGVQKTISKNLTAANASSLSNIEIINGLSLGGCNQGDGDRVLPEIRTAPILLYTWMRDKGQGCEIRQQAHLEYSDLDQASLQKVDNGLFANLAKGEPSNKEEPMHSSLGFEKNPWCMAWVGVKAKTAPHKPFAPFGEPVQLEARAFAQPFGGRVGPWYMSRWPKGGNESAGGERVDPLTPDRLSGAFGSTMVNKNAYQPNYSRYPGDKIGAWSQITMGAQRHIFQPILTKDKMDRIYFKFWSFFDKIPQDGDVLVKGDQNGNTTHTGSQVVSQVRKAEIAAIAPDLYDTTYYSIDPSYFLNYVEPGQGRFSGQLVNGVQVKQIGDIGSREGNQELAKFNVENQIAIAAGDGNDPQVLGKLYYVLRDWKHLLTSWAPNTAQSFDFPAKRFAECEQEATLGTMIPGKCVAGGRTGYSVRLISKSHLTFDQWKIGGEGEAPGPILNPPSPDF